MFRTLIQQGGFFYLIFHFSIMLRELTTIFSKIEDRKSIFPTAKIAKLESHDMPNTFRPMLNENLTLGNLLFT